MVAPDAVRRRIRRAAVSQANPAGELVPDKGRSDPEGATAPETLRVPDRGGMNTLESA
jgi:hypothetical protein